MELAENKDLFQTVFDSASNGIAVMQSIYNDKGRVEDFSIILFNTYTLKWIGDTDYKDKRYSDVFPTVKETGILEKFIEVAETGIKANFESWYTGENMQHWFRFTAVKQAELLVVTTEDITERKHAEVNLSNALDTAEKQKRLYDSITNNTPDLVYVFDPAYQFTYANKALLSMWGKTEEEAIGKGLRENGYEEWHAQMHEREIDEITITKKSIRGTVSFPHAELGRRVYDYILVPVLNEKGEVEAIAGTTRDITEIKQAEEKLQQSEARFRNLLQEAPVAATLLRGPDLIIEIANELTQKYWGKNKDIIGKPLTEAAPELKNQQMIAQLTDIYKHGGTANFSETPITFIEDNVLKNGYYTYSIKALYDINSNIDSILSVGIDVSEQVTARQKLEESERHFRALVNATSDVVYRMNADWTVMRNLEGRGFLSDTAEPIFNWIDKYIHHEDYETIKEAVTAAIEGKQIFELEHRVLNAQGAISWTFSKAIPILDEQNNIVEWFGSASDITPQKTLTEKLESLVAERTKELQRSNEDLQQFAHVASHDLKEPVRKIKTFADLLEQHLDGKLDESAKRFMERIHVATDRMVTMIDGVLAYSTINEGMQKPQLVDLNEVIKNIETDIEVSLQKTDGKILYHDLPTLDGAPVLLYQLFYNLINNSIKFSKAGVPPKITISSELSLAYDRHFAHITLKDNGIGFEPDYAGRIFETFTRLNPKDKYEGTGLGLSLCKKIVERHGGNIIAIGTPGEGATFIITLPLQQKQIGI